MLPFRPIPQQIAIKAAAHHSSKKAPPPTACSTPAPTPSSLPFQVAAVDQACIEAKLTPMTTRRGLAADGAAAAAAPVPEAAAVAKRALEEAPVTVQTAASEPQRCLRAVYGVVLLPARADGGRPAGMLLLPDLHPVLPQGRCRLRGRRGVRPDRQQLPGQFGLLCGHRYVRQRDVPGTCACVVKSFDALGWIARRVVPGPSALIVSLHGRQSAHTCPPID